MQNKDEFAQRAREQFDTDEINNFVAFLNLSPNIEKNNNIRINQIMEKIQKEETII